MRLFGKRQGEEFGRWWTPSERTGFRVAVRKAEVRQRVEDRPLVHTGELARVPGPLLQRSGCRQKTYFY